MFLRCMRSHSFMIHGDTVSYLRLPEEALQLRSTALRPGEVHAVITSIRRHHEATAAAGIAYPVVINVKAKTNTQTNKHEVIMVTIM